MSTQTLSNPITLTVNERHIQILTHLSKGSSSKQISETVHASTRAVEKVIERLKERFDCKNTTELVAFALRNKIID